MKFLKVLVVLFLFFSCNAVKSPEFKGVDKIDVVKKNNGKMVLVAYAQFYNPNLLGGKFKLKDVKVYVNNKFLANLNTKTYKVPVKKDFFIPLEVNLDDKFFKNDNLLDIVNNVLSNKLFVQYKGKIYYQSYRLNIPYVIDYKQDVKLIK